VIRPPKRRAHASDGFPNLDAFIGWLKQMKEAWGLFEWFRKQFKGSEQ
jgi:hypothetical protein